MRAIEIVHYGGPEALVWNEVPDPVPGPGEVLVEVTATAVNRADVLQRQGSYDPPPGAPAYPGLECSGRVLALGPETSGWSVGQPVCALLAGGGYAERVAVPVGQLLPVPAGVDPRTAAALPEVACTVESNLFQVAGLRPGETLLVHGGASGIGTFAIQRAVAAGVRVIVTAGTPEKLKRCRELGADVAISYRTEDFAARVLEETGGRGADVVLDMIGGAYLGRNVEVLATGGRLVIIGLQGGSRAELDLGLLQRRRATVTATTLRARPLAEKAEIVARVRAQVWPLIESGRIRPVVDQVLPITEAAAAHHALEAGDHVGKIILTVH
ncbi:NAD(P)H-quinone oxidoreductase [Acrocarpospora pleiomorpha]|uniref:NAD(P)H-quinone oxidoreductase n=1 Tax=Acrocarpospora pleiomorpha TaxID=90975 RepID=UPI0012D2BF8C|nr:NAD(P)H-quinone oxidoreductase [Acrocarpospora pleiomorpha]